MYQCPPFYGKTFLLLGRIPPLPAYQFKESGAEQNISIEKTDFSEVSKLNNKKGTKVRPVHSPFHCLGLKQPLTKHYSFKFRNENQILIFREMVSLFVIKLQCGVF